MKDENETQVAWQIWNLVTRFNDIIWDRYEDEFIELYLKEELKKHQQKIAEQYYDTTEPAF
jgi:hypothetical protein